ncbi:MAG TPA: DUF58 domain-containing protein [Terriglobia bacterium]|nr:DUF58 domain-containing protein [Terriglobia bacterium]
MEDRLEFEATAPVPLARGSGPPPDWKAWQRFLLALFGLGFALFLALGATALREAGHFGLAAGAALAALVMSAVVAVRTVPYLARRTVLGRLMVRLEYEFTGTGLVYLLVVVALSLAAVNTGNNLLYILLASLLAALIVSGAVSRVVLQGLEVELELPEHIFARQPTPARLTLRNRKRFFASFAVTLTTPAPKRRRGRPEPPGVNDRALLTEPVYWDYVPRQSARVRQLELTLPSRGLYAQEGFRIGTRFPFGLLVKARRLPAKQQVIVLPAIQPTEEFYEVLPLVSGEVESMAKGRGHDLYAIRDYRPGDPARHVDWKATARTQQLKVREFTREDERRVILVFDARLGRGDAPERARFEKGVELGACLAWHFYEIGAEMQFVTQGYETRLRRAGEVIFATLERLALVEPWQAPEGDLLARIPAAGPGFHIILTSQPRGSIPTGLWSTSYIVFFDSL